MALLAERTGWAHDAIASCDSDDLEQHDDDLDGLDAALCEVEALVLKFGNQHHYSDGRRVTSRVVIEHGCFTEHIWHPDPSMERVLSWDGTLNTDPGMASRGTYTVELDPATQTITTTVVRTG